MNNKLYLPQVRNTAMHLIKVRLVLEKVSSVPKYIRKLFKNWCRKKREITLQTFAIESQFMNFKMKNLFIDENNTIKLHMLKMLFPKLKQYCDTKGKIQFIDQPLVHVPKLILIPNNVNDEANNGNFWICKQCTYTNRPLFVNSMWRYYNKSIHCLLCDNDRYTEHNVVKTQNDKTLSKYSNSILNLKSKIQSIADQQCLFGMQNITSLSTKQLIYLLKNYILAEIKESNPKRMIDSYLTEIISYFEQNHISGKIFTEYFHQKEQKAKLRASIVSYSQNQQLNGSLPTLFKAIMNFDLNKVNDWKHNQQCPYKQRMFLIVEHFEQLTSTIYNVSGKYPYNMRTMLSSLPNYGPVELLNDMEHIIDHQPRHITKCSQLHINCIHFQRARAYKMQSSAHDINTNANDLVYVNLLDRLHTSLKHPSSNISINNGSMSVYVHMEYTILKPLYLSLCQEITQNTLYTLSPHQFESQIDYIREFKESNNEILKLQSHKTNKECGLTKGDVIGAQHLLCIMLYCNFSGLCAAFRKSH
eukprot:400125_1